MRPATVVIGVANPRLRGGGVGPRAVDLLRRRHLPDVVLVVCDDPTRVPHHHAALTVVVEGIHSDPPRPARVHRVVLHGQPMTVLLAVETAGTRSGLTLAVGSAVRRVVDEVAALVRAGGDPMTPYHDDEIRHDDEALRGIVTSVAADGTAVVEVNDRPRRVTLSAMAGRPSPGDTALILDRLAVLNLTAAPSRR